MKRDYVVALGVACMDEYYTLQRWPSEGDKAVITPADKQVGGMIPNAGCVLAQNGIHTFLLDTMPKSLNTEEILRDLEKWGVDTSMVRYDSHANDACCRIYLTGKERTILVVDSNRPVITQTPEILNLLQNAAYIYCAPYNLAKLDCAFSLVGSLTAQGVRLALDVESWNISEQERHFVNEASILFFNEYGFSGYRQGRSEETCIEELLAKKAEAVVITLGKEGSRCYSRGGKVTVEGLDLPVRDTTGAGDTYNAAFLSMWMKRKPLILCAQYAGLAASRSVTLPGVRAGAVPVETVHQWSLQIKNKEKHNENHQTIAH